MEYVFVYGTLKKGFPNHVVINGSEFVSDAETVDPYVFKDYGPFPAVINQPGETTVKGEVYKVDDDTFARLDMLEGYPELYDRIVIPVKTSLGVIPATMYIASDNFAKQLSNAPDVEGGVWNSGKVKARRAS